MKKLQLLPKQRLLHDKNARFIVEHKLYNS